MHQLMGGEDGQTMAEKLCQIPHYGSWLDVRILQFLRVHAYFYFKIFNVRIPQVQ